MKRYDLLITETLEGDDILRESPDGILVYLADVTRTMIPRPDAEAARKAVDELISAATCFEAAHNNPLFEDYKEESIADLQRTKAAVLRHMGVEVK